MSKGTGIFLTLLLTFGWFWFCHWWYTCGLMAACPGGITTEMTNTTVEETAVLPAEATRYALDFRKGGTEPLTNEGFDALKASVLREREEGKELEIVGFYYEGEPSPEGFDNIGLARAAALAELFIPPLEPDKVIQRARLVATPEGGIPEYVEAGAFNWKEGPRETVEELKDRIIIRFPFSSVQKEYDPSVDEYLDKLAKRVRETGETVSLTGHTDNIGEEAANRELAMRRAEAIRDILVRKGVAAQQIQTHSRGESEPVASNDTEAGRHDNRRVEVRRTSK